MLFRSLSRSRRDAYLISAISALAECFKTERFLQIMFRYVFVLFYQAFISSFCDLTKISREKVIRGQPFYFKGGGGVGAGVGDLVCAWLSVDRMVKRHPL